MRISDWSSDVCSSDLLDPRNVLDPHHRTVGIGANDDVFELLRTGQTALGGDRELKLLVPAHRGGADPPDRRLAVLALNGRSDLGRSQPQVRELVGIEPTAHRVERKSTRLNSSP